MTDNTKASGREKTVIALVCGGHFVSHFYTLTLPPLFPLVIADLGLSYTALGAMLTAYAITSGVLQYPMGILVDRFGAPRFIIAGLVVYASAIGLMGLADSQWTLIALGVMAGLGNSVFHPADYAVLGGMVNPDRLGRAYAVHTFSGNVGWVVAPGTVTFLAAFWNWRVAMGAAALMGLAMAVVLLSQRRLLMQTAPKGRAPSKMSESGTSVVGFSVILSPAILMMFCFMLFNSMTNNAVQNFSPSVLINLHGMDLVSANMALTGWLVGAAVGILVGGFLADWLKRLDQIAAVGFTVAASILIYIAFVKPPLGLLVACFILGGFMLGMIMPSRDLMVQSAAPKGSSGRAFGFVFSASGVGGAVAPIAYGFFIDQGRPDAVFLAGALLMILSLITALMVSRLSTARKPQAAE